MPTAIELEDQELSQTLVGANRSPWRPKHLAASIDRSRWSDLRTSPSNSPAKLQDSLRRLAAEGIGSNLIHEKAIPVHAAPDEPLDLTGLPETATIQAYDLSLALWTLSSPKPPSEIRLPESNVLRRRLARAGLLFAADRREVPLLVDGTSVTVPEALGLPGIVQTVALEEYDLETSDRMRVVSNLESRLRRPPQANEQGRRYYWIDGLGVAAGHPEREFFDRQADQCYFELVDNVHRWARASRSIAIASATKGGGEDSYNRLHIVVFDDGMGILPSVRAKAAELSEAGRSVECLCRSDKTEEVIAREVIGDLLGSVYGGRQVVGASGGHGLHTIDSHVSRWSGTMDVISTFAEGRALHLGRRGQQGVWTATTNALNGMQGTLIHLSLDAERSRAESPAANNRSPVAV